MPFHIVLRNSNTSGSVPSLRSLVKGELAINTYNGRIYLKKVVGQVERLVSIGGIDDIDGAKNYLLYVNESGSVTSSIAYQNGGFIGLGKTGSLNSILDVSGSITVTGSINITGSFTVFSGSTIDFQVTDTGTKQGNASTDTHRFTGSVNISGGLFVNNIKISPVVPLVLTSSNFTLVSSSNDYYTTKVLLTIDCSANTFFTYTSSFVTKSLNYTGSLVSSSVFNFVNSSSLAYPLPSGSQKGDLYLIGVTSTNAITSPTGWTVATSSLINSPSAGDSAFSLFYLIQTGSTTPIDPTISFASTTTSTISVGFSLLLRNVNISTTASATPPSVASYIVSASSGAFSPDPPPIITPSYNNFGVVIGFAQDNVTDISAPAGFTLRVSGSFRSPVSSNYRAVMAATANSYTSGSTNPAAFGGSYTNRVRGISLFFTSITGSQAFAPIPTFNNIPTSQSYVSTHLVKTADENSLNWDSNVYWSGGNTPYLSGSTTSLLTLTTIDGGNSIFGESSLNYPTF